MIVANSPRSRGLARISWVAVAMIAATAVLPGSARAQGFRGWSSTNVQSVGLRPITVDTIPSSQVDVDAAGRATYQGQPVTCTSDSLCIGYRALDQAHAVAVTEDVSLTAWGLGMQGLSVTTLLRARAHGGTDFVWPRSDDNFDAMLAYAQLVRGPVRVRAGRQEVRSGLGFSAFDGASASYTRWRTRAQLYGGRSLARGLREPANVALRGIEDFVPDKSVYLIGGSVGTRLSSTSVTARYQREILSDRSGLESERGSLDLTSALPGLMISGSLDYDFAFSRLGKGHLTLTRPLAQGHWLLEATARRYVPYFSLSTIWGYFEPVSYEELQARVSWSASPRLSAWATGGWRSYGNAGTAVVLSPLEDHGKTASAGLTWQTAASWTVQGSYELQWVPGGFLSSADASVSWRPSERVSLAATGTTFQQIEQYRLGDGRAYGGGFNFDVGVTGRASLTGGVSVMRLENRGGSVNSPWNQTRAWSGLRIAVGSDPGMAAGRAR